MSIYLALGQLRTGRITPTGPPGAVTRLFFAGSYSAQERGYTGYMGHHDLTGGAYRLRCTSILHSQSVVPSFCASQYVSPPDVMGFHGDFMGA